MALSGSLSSSSLTSLATNEESVDSFVGDICIRVDRSTLETMLNGGDSSTPSATDFFIDVSNKSGAIISYPQKGILDKIGRKDPEIRIIGSPFEIHSARSLIMDMIGRHRNRVTFKMDVSHTDHSHVIGKGGKRIQSIMNSTECHIHFPDGNRVHSEEKSNQVTIAGTGVQQIEEARQQIRQYLPLTISFQTEINGGNIAFMDSSHPKVRWIQSRYSVLMSFRLPELSFGDKPLAYIIIRGSRVKFDDIKEAAQEIYQLLNWSSVGFNNTVINIDINIAAQHHTYVMGRGNCNVKAINDHTGAVVSFPDLMYGSPSSATQRPNPLVTIRGRGIESAFLAWLELLSYLPIVLIFDLQPNQEIDGKLLTALMANQLLSIMIRPKVRSDLKSIVIKAQERYTNLLFEARNHILGLESNQLNEWSSQTTLPATACSLSMKHPSGFPRYPFTSDFEPEILRAFRQVFDKQ